MVYSTFFLGRWTLLYDFKLILSLAISVSASWMLAHLYVPTVHPGEVLWLQCVINNVGGSHLFTVCLRVSTIVIKYWYQKQSQPITEGSQGRKLEAGIEAEVMGGCCSLACSSWLVQPVFHFFLKKNNLFILIFCTLIFCLCKGVRSWSYRWLLAAL